MVESLGEAARSGNMSVIENNGLARVVRYKIKHTDNDVTALKKSNKPKFLVYKVVTNFWGEIVLRKKIRGFRRKDAAEKFAAKSRFYVIETRT